MKPLENILDSNFEWKEVKYSVGDIKKRENFKENFFKNGLIFWDHCFRFVLSNKRQTLLNQKSQMSVLNWTHTHTHMPSSHRHTCKMILGECTHLLPKQSKTFFLF